MLALVGLMVTAVGLALLVLPVWSFVRVTRLTREVERLRARLDALQVAGVEPRPQPADVDPAEPAPSGGLSHAPHAATPEAVSVTPPADTAGADDLEAWVGGRWLLYAGVAILLIGISFFLKYAFDNAWVDERGRVILGGLAGVAMIVTGSRLAPRLPAFGRALSGAGIATLYLAIYAAFGFYALVAGRTALIGMVITTGIATWLADRDRAESLAVIAAMGGYATPFLVERGSPSPLVLFPYFLLLGGGALALTRRHRWLGLPVAAYLLTVVAVALWAGRYYTSGQWLVLLLFLTALCAVFLEILRFVRRQHGVRATIAGWVLWSAPVVYHAAAVALTVNHPPAIHLYLILFTVVTLLLLAAVPSGWVRLPALVASYAPLFAYLDLPRGPSWIAPNVVTAVAIGAMHTAALVDRATRQRRALGTGDLAVMHATAIGLYGLLSEMLGPEYPDWPGGVAAILAIASAGLWRFFERRDPGAALNAAGLSFALVAIALATQWDGRVVVIGWAAEGAVAAWFGLRASNLAFKAGGLLLFAMAAGRLADGYFSTEAGTASMLNDRTGATAVLVALAYLLAWQWRRWSTDARREGLVPVVAHVLASVFTVMWMSAEITSFWRAAPREAEARLSEELTRSLAWGVYGSALVAIGMWRSLASLRWIGITVITLTVLKVFVVDLSQLGGIYRVVGFIAVGILLVGVSYLYQRGRGGRRVPAATDPARGA